MKNWNLDKKWTVEQFLIFAVWLFALIVWGWYLIKFVMPKAVSSIKDEAALEIVFFDIIITFFRSYKLLLSNVRSDGSSLNNFNEYETTVLTSSRIPTREENLADHLD